MDPIKCLKKNLEASIQAKQQLLADTVDKYSEREKTHSGKEAENRGSAVPLHEEGYPLKLDALLS